MAEGLIRNLQIVPIAPIGQCGLMFEPLLILIAATFLFAGFVKGVVGLGLPTVSMGLLAVTMPPAQALAIVIVPTIVTNIWQTFGGPYLRDILRRLWPLMLGTVIGIRLNSGMLAGPYARYGTVILGVLLVIYAIIGLRKFTFNIAPQNEKWIGGGRRRGHRHDFGCDRRSGHPLDAVYAVDRPGKGGAVSGARRVLHGGDARVGVQPDQGRTAVGGDRAAGRHRAGLLRSPACLPARRCGRGCTRKTFRRWFLIAMIALGIYLAGNALYNTRLA